MNVHIYISFLIRRHKDVCLSKIEVSVWKGALAVAVPFLHHWQMRMYEWMIRYILSWKTNIQPSFFLFFYLSFYIFQEHFLNKHNGANMQIDTKKEKSIYCIKETRENDSYLVFSVLIVYYQTSAIWIGDNMPCHSG